MVIRAVKLNERFVPPYGSGASLYIRPVEIGLSAQVGVAPAKEYAFIVFVTPRRSLLQRRLQAHQHLHNARI